MRRRFVCIGAALSSNMLGFINFVLELAPAAERVTYIGLTNTLSGVLLIAPIVGATLVQLFSFNGLFVATALALAASLMLSFGLVEPRRRVSATGVIAD